MKTVLAVLTVGVVLSTVALFAQEEGGEKRAAGNAMDPRAAEILRAMSEHLQRAKAFTFTTRIVYDTPGAPKLQYGAEL